MNDNNFYEDEKNELLNLLNLDESDWLDFKSEWYKREEEFTYDVICLCNSLSKEPKRYLIIGVKDDTKEFTDGEYKNNKIPKEGQFKIKYLKKDNIINILNSHGINAFVLL